MARISYCLLLAIVCAVFPAKAADTATPEKVIRDFYHWYVQALIAGRNPMSKNRAELQRYASARLLHEIDRMAKGPDGLDGDYFLDAQDFDNEWAKNITVKPAAIHGDRATTEVELKGSEVGTRILRVALIQEKGAWKVDKVEGQQ